MTPAGGRAPTSGSALYRFVQWEFAWPLGPDDGRYVLRRHAGEEPHHVLVLATTAPPGRRAGRRGRRPREAPPEPPPSERGLSRVTLVDPARVDEAAARAWLDEDHAHLLAHLNHALRAHRVATADPYVREVDDRDPLVTRVGYGAGEEVASGRWTYAREIPGPSETGSRRQRRQAALRPQERLAALLSARDAVLACEELALRARLDLQHGRAREAALQTHLALEAAVAELAAFGSRRDMAERLAELDGRRERLAAAANEALEGGPAAQTMATVSETLERLEAALRARAASALWDRW